ncbi:MAG: class I SAM-dependent methyltransferase [Acidobacteriota bacterium]|nr:class I SAM-dependent methyltransferase [Acidobacteriota bacterium]
MSTKSLFRTRSSGGKTRYNDSAKIRRHYDTVSPYYRTLWGEHLHHGYWIRGDETKEEAQIQLVEHMARAAGIQRGARLLDVGCGFGGSSVYLAQKYGVEATGITISPVQVEMAVAAAAANGPVRAKFVLMDAQEMTFRPSSFDVVWSLESISHYQRKKEFFASAARLLRPQGTFAIIDWFKKENLDRRGYKKFLRPIEKGMMVSLDTMDDYAALLEANRLKVVHREILNEHCAKTWDLCLDIIRKKEFWKLAADLGPEFIHFLRAFRAMKTGFASGNLVYALLVAKRVGGKRGGGVALA